ncbi:ParA family protein [Deinococcus ruber]|nr:ParA family protein [Deinococcus ruber]
MIRISLLSRKGGVGKTLCSMAIAQVLSERHTVAVLDLDPEGSARAWAHDAQAQNSPLPYQVFGPVEAAMSLSVDYLIVDTPPNDAKTLAATAKLSDVILVPVQPGKGEIDRLEPTMDVLREGNFKPGGRMGILLNYVEHDNLSAAMPEALTQLGYPMVAPIKKSVEYRRAFGGLIPQHLLEPFRLALGEVGIDA